MFIFPIKQQWYRCPQTPCFEPVVLVRNVHFLAKAPSNSGPCMSYGDKNWSHQPSKHALTVFFLWHTLPYLDQIHSISEVIILNNDQHQHQKTISTNNRINSKINQHLTPFCRLALLTLWQRSFAWESMFVCCWKACLAWKTISCQTEKGNRVIHSQI